MAQPSIIMIDGPNAGIALPVWGFGNTPPREFIYIDGTQYTRIGTTLNYSWNSNAPS